MKILVTGCCGFVGSNLVDRLLLNGHSVVGIDDLSTGHIEHIQNHITNKNFVYAGADENLNHKLNDDFWQGIDCVIHLAAMADIRFNKNNYSLCLSKNIDATNNVLEMCVKHNIKKLLFASTCSVYGNSNKYPTNETDVVNQTSIYSATKIASEKIIEGFANTFKFQAYAMRFVSMLGPRYSHGHVYDFVKKIINNESELRILNNGDSLKSYLHIYDAVEAIIKLINYESMHNFEIFNIGHRESIKLKYSVDTIVKQTKYMGKICYSQQLSGWIGDNPIIIPDIQKMEKMGWFPIFSIEQGINSTVDWIMDNKWIL